MIKLGLLGAGQHSAYHHGPSLRHLAKVDPSRVQLAAVCDLDEVKARDYAVKFGFANVYTDLDAMLAREKLDALILITPLPATVEIVSRMLPTRLPIVIEKPPGLFPDDTARLLELAKRHDSPHMVSFNRRFDPAVEKARQWLAANAAGRPVLQVIARMLRVERREERFIADTGIHLVDAVLSFMSEPVHFHSRRWAPPTGGESCDGRIEFADGSWASLFFAPDCGVKEETYELIGSEYDIQIDTFRHGVKVFDRGKLAMEWLAPADIPPYIGDGALAETERFLSAVEGKQPYWPTLADGLVSMRVAHALQNGQA